MNSVKNKTYDVVVIGSGGAGCAAALTASRAGKSALILTRADFLDSKTSRAQGGIQAPLADNDSAEKLYQDTLAAGEFENDKPLTRLLADHATDTVEWLMDIGIEFDRDDSGNLLQRGAAGISVPRVLSCGDASGNRIMAPLIAAVSDSDINVETYKAVTSISEENCGFEVTAFDPRDDTRHTFSGTSVVLATGGAMPELKRGGLAKVGQRHAPDSIELASEIGLEIENPDLTQFHPTGIVIPKALRRKPVPELVRGVGANLTNANGDVFADHLLTRKKLCDAIVKECDEGRCITTEDGRKGVYLNTPLVNHLNGDGYFETHFATLYNELIENGVDPNVEPVLVYPIAHYSLGGIKIGPNCETTISGIFAAGEATWGVHGKDRLMGNSLLEIFVFGRIAGTSAALYTDDKPRSS
jgi:succinate dehydrogenase / fumarate reductase flavoprotein subunit/L-aspartate oxidase